MEITYHGHSCFRLKGKLGTVVTDPYHSYVGFSLPNLTADVVTTSHDHQDHHALDLIKGTARRAKPFVIDTSGEYEVGGISVFGVRTYHDAHQGVERGQNVVFTMLIDDLRVCHLGDLGHLLTPEQISDIGAVDVVLCPVGGVFTIDPHQATTTIQSLEPSFAIPMHYQTANHNSQVFGELSTLADFMREYGTEVQPQPKLTVEAGRLPEETELVVLTPVLNI